MLTRFPVSVKVVTRLLALALALYLLMYFKAVLVPLVFAVLFSFLMHPTCRALEKARIPRPFAIIICLLLIMTVVAGVIWFLSSQMLRFQAELTGLTKKLEELVLNIQLYLQEKIGLDPSSNSNLIKQSLSNLGSSGGSVISSTIAFTTDMLTFVGLVPIYFFCLLYYRDHLRKFMFTFIEAQQRGALMSVVDDVRKVVQSYLTGLAIVIVIVSLLNSAGLMILGVNYAIFFGVAASILMIIPYIGILIGSLMPAFYVLVTTGKVSTALGVIGIMAFVQFLEGNFITPNIVGSKVRMNAFAAILALVVGGHIWDTAGMILAIPVIAIIKVIFDHYEPLMPFGMLLGDISHREEEGMFSGVMKKIKGIFTKAPDNPDLPSEDNLP